LDYGYGSNWLSSLTRYGKNPTETAAVKLSHEDEEKPMLLIFQVSVFPVKTVWAFAAAAMKNGTSATKSRPTNAGISVRLGF